MKKFIKSYIAGLVVTATLFINGCDIFESFQFGLPITINIESEGATPFGSTAFCFTNNETYLQYQDEINSINFVAAYIVTEEVSPDNNLSGDVHIKLYEGSDTNGQLLFEHIVNNFTPAENDINNPYKMQLTPEEINNINSSLSNNIRCFTGVYEVQNISGGGPNNFIKVKIDALFNVDAKLD